jgi:hypothetical protein
MTKNDALIMQTIAGAFGQDLTIRKIRGKTVVSQKPDFSKRILSPKQELVNSIMGEANDYAKHQMRNKKLRDEAQLRLNVTSKRLYTSLVSEYWKNNWAEEKNSFEKKKKKTK